MKTTLLIACFIACNLYCRAECVSGCACKDSIQHITHLINMGEKSRDEGDLESCLIAYKEALRMSENQNDTQTLILLYSNIAKICFDCHQIPDAIIFGQKALEYSLKSNDKNQIAVAYCVMGIYLCEGREYTEGIDTLEKKAIPLLKETKNDLQLCKAYHRLIMTYNQLGKTQAVIHYMGEFEKYSYVLKTDEDWYHYYRAKGMELKSGKHYKEALSYFQKVINIIEKKGYQNSINHQAYRMGAECCMAMGNYNESYRLLNKAYQLRDSIFLKRQSLQLAYYTIEYRLKTKELEIAQLEQTQLERATAMLRLRNWTIFVTLLLLIAVSILLLKRQRQKIRLTEIARIAEEKERQILIYQKETERRLTSKYIEGLESERNRLAAELHDDVCNRLMSLEMKTRSLTNEMSAEAADQIDVLADIRNRVRNVSHALMPPVFQFATLDEMLSDHIRHLELAQNMKVEYTSTENVDWSVVNEEIGFEFYRIIQEGLSNCIKHSCATRIEISLHLEKNQLSASIQDNGKGFDIEKKKGIGLRTICQRIHSIGGNCQIDSAPGTGTRIEISVLLA